MLDLLIRATAVMAVGLVLSLSMRRSSAWTRVVALRATLIATVLTGIVFLVGLKVAVPVLPAEEPAPTSTVSTITYEMVEMEAEVPPQPDQRPLVAWSAGFGLCLAVLGVSGRRLRALNRNSEPIVCPDAEDQLRTAVGKRTVVARTAQPLDTALTFGFLRHVVLFPASVSEWAQEHRRAVVLHEAAHIRRFDCAWQWFALAFRAVLWFHPLAWILAWAHREQAELAADEFAIASGVPAPDYAEALLSFARLPNNRGLVRSQGAFTMSHHPLKRRVHAALRPQRGHSSLLTLGLVAMTTSVGLLGGLLQTEARSPIPPTPPQAAIETRAAAAPRSSVALPAQAAAPTRAESTAAPARPAQAPRIAYVARTIKGPSRVDELKREKLRLLAVKKALLAEKSNPEVRRLEAEVLKLRKEVAALQKSRMNERAISNVVYETVVDAPMITTSDSAVKGWTVSPATPADVTGGPGLPARAADRAPTTTERSLNADSITIPPSGAAAAAAPIGEARLEYVAVAPTAIATTTAKAPKRSAKAKPTTTIKPKKKKG